MADIDHLEIQIKASADKAVKGIEALGGALKQFADKDEGAVGKLERLSAALAPFKDLSVSSTIAKQLKEIGKALDGIPDASSISNIEKFAKSFAPLGSLKLSSTIAKNLGQIAETAKKLSGVDAGAIGTLVANLSGSLGGLGNIDKTALSALSKIGSGIQKLGELDTITKSLDDEKINAFGDAIEKLAEKMKPLAEAAKDVYNGLKITPELLDKYASSVGKLKGPLVSTSKHFNLLGISISGLASRDLVRSAKTVFDKIAGAVKGWVNTASEYIENVNLFQVSMGEFYDEAFAYAQLVEDKMGIDASEWMRNQGVFMSMAKGFGLANEQAYALSEGLTELSYDLSSLYNESSADSALRLQSALAGEIEPIRRLGISITEATLQEYALSKGIQESVSTMTEQEKALLRSVKIMEDAKRIKAIGDFAKTLESPANAIRVLNQQITQLKRALGTLLIPALTAVLPYIQAFVGMITDAVAALASLFGFKMPDWDTKDWEKNGGDAQGAVEGVTGAVKELKNATLGIDELNVISPQSGVSSVPGATSDWAKDLVIPDLWGDLVENLETKTDEIKKKLEDIAFVVGTIGTALLGWKVLETLSDTIKKFPTGILWLIAGAILAAAGGAAFLYYILDALENGITLENLAGMFAGLAFAVAGLELMGLHNLALLAAFLGGVAIAAVAVKDAFANGLNMENLIALMLGATVAVAALGARFGNLGLVVGGIVAGIALLTVGINSLINDGITAEGIRAIAAGFMFLSLATSLISPTLGMIIALVGLLVVVFLKGWDEIRGVFAAAGVLFSRVVGSLQNFLSFVDALLGNIVKAVANMGIALFEGFSAVVHNLVTLFKNGFNNIQSLAYLFLQKITEGLLWITEKLNGIATFFGFDPLQTDGFTNKIEELEEARKKLEESKEEYIDVSAAFDEGLHTFEYADPLEAMTHEGLFSGGLKEDLAAAYENGKRLGEEQQQGFIDAISGMFSGNDELFSVDTGMFAPDQNYMTPDLSSISADMEEMKSDLQVNPDEATMNNFLESMEKMNAEYQEFTAKMQEENEATVTDATNKVKESAEVVTQTSDQVAVKNEEFVEKLGLMYEEMGDKSTTAIQKIIDMLAKIPRNITTTHTIITKNVSGDSEKTSVQKFATGGFPNVGQLFVAREQGAEMVGSIGGRAAVANNDQIVEAVSSGVYNAMVSAMGTEQGKNINLALYIDGKQVEAAVRNVQHRRGATIATGGIFNYG